MRGYFIPRHQNFSLLKIGGLFMKTQGVLKEDEMIYFLNNRKIKELSPNLYTMLQTLYGVLDPEWTVYCETAADLTKPDFVVTVNGKSRYVSMKSNNTELVHSEQISAFIPFLRSLGVSKDTLKTLLLYYYGDGTLNGTGQRRLPCEALATWLGPKLEACNEELNNDYLLSKIIDRFIFQGVNENAHPAEAIYVGDVHYGTIVTAKQIWKRFSRNDCRWRNYRNLHVGPFFLKPAARYADKPIKSIERRNTLRVEWPDLREDVEYIAKRFDSYTPMRHRTYEE